MHKCSQNLAHKFEAPKVEGCVCMRACEESEKEREGMQVGSVWEHVHGLYSRAFEQDKQKELSQWDLVPSFVSHLMYVSYFVEKMTYTPPKKIKTVPLN